MLAKFLLRTQGKNNRTSAKMREESRRSSTPSRSLRVHLKYMVEPLMQIDERPDVRREGSRVSPRSTWNAASSLGTVCMWLVGQLPKDTPRELKPHSLFTLHGTADADAMVNDVKFLWDHPDLLVAVTENGAVHVRNNPKLFAGIFLCERD